jgi:hypothetical protein
MRMSGHGADQLHYFSRPGVASERLLGENEVVVHGHVEDAAGRWDLTNFGIREGVSQLSRQTGGSGLVVSDDAVLDRDDHGCLSSGYGMDIRRES